MNDIRVTSSVSIGPGHRPFVIAEMSGNHNGSLARALKIVDGAAAAGVSALKIQTYTADTMTIDSDRPGFRITDPKSLWSGRKLYDLYREASTPWEWHKPIFERCARRGVIGFSTPFDPTAVDFLESLDVPMYKVASFENIDLPLIRRVARTGKPMIISTGMATENEIGEAVEAARGAGCRRLVLLKCTSAYPASPASANLATIADLARRFRCLSGVSDHTLGTAVSVAAVALGAVAIEKHFTLKRADGGVDSAFSMEPSEMAALVRDAEAARVAGGTVTYGPSKAEIKSLGFRRSLYVVRDLKKGERLTTENLRSIRPGFGLPPKHMDDVLGRAVTANVRRGTPLTWRLVGGRRTAK